MKNFAISKLLMVMLILCIFSCVPAKKYKSLQDTGKMYLNERDALKAENITLAMDKKWAAGTDAFNQVWDNRATSITYN